MLNPLILARLCAEAYDASPVISDKNRVARCTVQIVDGIKVLAFPGTEPTNLHDDLADIDVLTETVPRLGQVHQGFWNAMRGIAEDCNHAMGDDPVILTGHSLGGAIALALAAYRSISMLPTLGVVTFGAPRISVGKQLGQTLAGMKLTLYRHASDPIPHLPLDFPLLEEWEQPAPLVQLGDDCGLPSIEAHLIQAYIAALEHSPLPLAG